MSIQAVLLYKRTTDAPIHPSYWALFGGKKEDKEKIEVTLKREVDEELEAVGMNIALSAMESLCEVDVVREDGIVIIKYYKASLDRDMDCLKLKRDKAHGKVEGEGLAWFTEEEIHHLYLRPEDRKALSRFFA